MKARTDAHAEAIYNNKIYENFAPSNVGLQCAINEDSLNLEPLKNASQGILENDVAVRKSSIESSNFNTISNDLSTEKKLYPLHFNTNEVLEKTPAIFKSLNSGTRGPNTFVFNSTLKPASLSCNDDPCKTFVITYEKWESPNNENSLNEELFVVGGQNFDSNEKNEYLSYVIEKTDACYSKKMNEKITRPKNDTIDNQHHCNFQDLDETDRASEVSLQNTETKIGEKVNLSISEVCDTKVQCENVKKTTEDILDISFDRTITGKKEQTFARLQDELKKAHQELKLKDEEVTRLTRIREDVEKELEELTASLFQEAHKMVSKAKEKQAAAEKSLKESQMKVDVLTAEVLALKTLVLTSTPSRPNPHLHPQISKEENCGGVNLFNKKHRRSPSHFNLKYGRENSPPESPVRDEQNTVSSTISSSIETRDISEVDPIVHKEFMNWTLTCKLDKADPFIDRIYREDINLCLDFSNRELAEEVQKAIETKNIFIEAVTDKSKTVFPRKCALLEVTRQCHYRMKLGDQDIWHNISQMCRNRIIAVCDFINYLRYIELGLVKSSAHDMYWEIMRLRKEMVLARLGLSLPPP